MRDAGVGGLSRFRSELGTIRVSVRCFLLFSERWLGFQGFCACSERFVGDYMKMRHARVEDWKLRGSMGLRAYRVYKDSSFGRICVELRVLRMQVQKALWLSPASGYCSFSGCHFWGLADLHFDCFKGSRNGQSPEALPA